ncbi:hypothetical protein AX17_001697 [Amanita inopinata Kibby_2008]|nr:hypothetical protein AX17_001697 [Amanita inopinata Kibby_2008]
MTLIPARGGAVQHVETYREKAARKFKENPLVLLGSLATVAALVVASVKMKRGESQKLNHWLRVRVAAQGFTVLAVCAGTYAMRKREQDAAMVLATANGVEGTEPTRNGADINRHRQERIDMERREFEERLKEAEEIYRLETQSGLTSGMNKTSEAVSVTVPGSTSTMRTGLPSQETVKSGKGWLSWLGWSSGSRSSSSSSSQSKGDRFS